MKKFVGKITGAVSALIGLCGAVCHADAIVPEEGILIGFPSEEPDIAQIITIVVIGIVIAGIIAAAVTLLIKSKNKKDK